MDKVLLAISFSLVSAWAFPQEWTIYDIQNSPLPSTTVRALVADGADGLWVGTDWGLCHLDYAGDWTVYQEATSPLVENDIRALQRDGQGRLWIGTVSMGLQVKDGDQWTIYTPLNSPLPEFGIRDLFVDANDAIWICTSGGLAMFDGLEWSIYNDTPDSHQGAVLETANTNAVAVAADGTICLGTFNGGLHFIQGGSVEVLTSFDDGFFDNTAVDVAFHPSTGARWVATPAAGLLRQQGPVVGGLWTQWSGATGFPSNATTALAFDQAGDVWVGTQIAGLVQVKADGTFVQYTQGGSGLPDNNVRAIMTTPDGAIWVGTVLGGLARYEPAVSVQEFTQGAALQAWPNPAREQVTISCTNGCRGSSWQLLQADGRLVSSGRSYQDQFVLPLQDIPSGCYVVLVSEGSRTGLIRVFVD